MVSSSPRRIILAIFIVFLFFPYLLLTVHLPGISAPDLSELWWAFKNSFLQAFAGAFFTLLLAVYFLRGYAFLANRCGSYVWLLNLAVLLPTLLPALFIILIVMATLSPFPIGIIGTTIIYCVLNVGLATLLLMNIVDRKLRPLLELSAIEGASFFQFLRASKGWIARDILGIFIFLFILNFANFSVPFTVGGGQMTTLEILIYEKIRISGQWGEALFLAFFQLIILAAFSFLQSQFRPKLTGRSESVFLLPAKVPAILFLIFVFSPFVIFLVKSFSAWDQVFLIPNLWQQAQDTILTSVMLSLGVGFVTLFLLFLTVYVESSSLLHRLLNSIIAPSTALVGFSMLFFLVDREPWNSLKWILGFSYLIFTTLYRWGWNQSLTDLKHQIAVAESLGASKSLIFLKIQLPQLLKPACQIAGIASLWAMGDFALGKIVLGEDVTLALLIETLMTSYRTEAALALMNLLFLMGFLTYFFFIGVAYVGRRASEKDL